MTFVTVNSFVKKCDKNQYYKWKKPLKKYNYPVIQAENNPPHFGNFQAQIQYTKNGSENNFVFFRCRSLVFKPLRRP